jgi:phosphatidate cytidylyltransferase
MKKLIQRLFMFIIGLPLSIFIVIGFPFKNHLAANTAVVILSALGALEFGGMLRKEGFFLSPGESIVLGCLCPLAMTLTVSFGLSCQLLPAALITGAFWCLIRRIFSGPETLQDISRYVTAGFSVLIYPGLFMMWIIRLARLPHAGLIILSFLLTAVATDSTAWAAGMLFGRGNSGVVPVSPNKSIAGFAGGLIASCLVGLGTVIFLPAAFSSPRIHFAAAGLILGFLTGAAASLGDLAESAIKRSSGTKDSGAVILGRGGVLDSIDSIALAAPVFYGLYGLLFELPPA